MLCAYIHWPGVLHYASRTALRTLLSRGGPHLRSLYLPIGEVTDTCQYCNGKAICNLRLADGKAAIDGPTVQLGDTEYHPVCWRHYDEAVRAAQATR